MSPTRYAVRVLETDVAGRPTATPGSTLDIAGETVMVTDADGMRGVPAWAVVTEAVYRATASRWSRMADDELRVVSRALAGAGGGGDPVAAALLDEVAAELERRAGRPGQA